MTTHVCGSLCTSQGTTEGTEALEQLVLQSPSLHAVGTEVMPTSCRFPPGSFLQLQLTAAVEEMGFGTFDSQGCARQSLGS